MIARIAILLLCIPAIPCPGQRPMIWVRAEERPAILQRIEEHPHVRAYYQAFTERVAGELARHEGDPGAYLRQLPLAAEARSPGKIPPLKTFLSFQGDANEQQDVMQSFLQNGMDCAVLYWLTGEARYARYAADILHTFVGGLLPIKPSFDNFNGGWVYPEDHLREAREIGAQLPIIYDFIHDYLDRDGTVFDLGTGAEGEFDRDGAQRVFRTYARLAVEQGIINCNWPILEMPSLLHNALALEDPAERAGWLKHVTDTSTAHQDAFPKIAEHYGRYGGTWPESFGYAQHVSQNLTYVLTVLKHHGPESDYLEQYPSFVAALPQARYFTYPDGKQTILFGDGHRPYQPLRDGLEMAYHLAGLSGEQSLRKEVGALLGYETEKAGYRRFQLPKRNFGASIYREPLTLLWYEPEVEATAGSYPLPVTDELPFAGITLQRNMSASGDPRDAFMYFVGGAGFVHGHASGMNMELYGKGEVLGAKSGRSSYRTDIHENYYRLFASHNTVVVNGASQGEGDWVNLGIETVQREVAEPAPGAAPLTDRYSFSTSSFADIRGDSAEAQQQRTVAIVRTSDTSGYYVDVYRSRSELPGQFHDYIYHNIGERLSLTDASTGSPLSLYDDPDRYAAAADKPHRYNREFRNPGWHFFRAVESVVLPDADVTAEFTTTALDGGPLSMKLFLPGMPDREYTRTMAPPSTESPAPYDKLPTPTLVVRKEGEAWDRPFITVLEPGDDDDGDVISVEEIPAGTAGAKCCGISVLVGSGVKERMQYVLSLDGARERFANADYSIDFRGRFAILDVDGNGVLKGIYIGEGQQLTYRGTSVAFAGARTGSAYIDFIPPDPVIRSAMPMRLTLGGKTISYQPEKTISTDEY